MEKHDASLPSYEDSIVQGSTSDPKLPRGQQIIDDITLSRTQNLSYVAAKHVIPEVERRAREGQAQTVIVLLPSDIIRQDDSMASYGFDDSSPKFELMGFPQGEEIVEIELDGAINRSSFWRQRGVMDDFVRLLRDRLSTSQELQRRAPELPVPVEPAAPEPAKQRRGFFSRLSSSSSSPKPPESESVAKAALESGESLKVEARLQEVCLRTVSGFGLYETVSRQAIVITVNVRC